MSHPDPELLADLALDEPTTDELREHVEHCAPCRDEVASLRATVGSLRGPLPELVPPRPGLRGTVLAAAFAGDRPADSGGGGAAPATGAPVVDELAARRASSPARPGATTPTRRFGAAWLVGAAAAGLVVGGVGVAAIERTPAQQSTVVAQTDLDTLDTGARLGVADLVRHNGVTDLALHTDEMSAGEDGYLEVWLINRDGERMVSIGVLEPGRADQTFAVPADLVAQGYVIVDISREPFDADATHSGDSLARGTLPV